VGSREAPPQGSPGPSGRIPPADPRSEPGWAAGLPEAGAADRRLIEAQIGRDVRGSVAVAARCRYGLPAVVRTAPLLPDGTPFPTLYWLACPAARVAVGRLEAAGWNAKLSERVAADPDLAAAHAAAHASYLAQRDTMARLPGDPGVGGLPGRVKCLHALYAHQAAIGANPVGRIVSQAVDPIDCPGPCVDTNPAPEPAHGPAAPGPAASGGRAAPGGRVARGRAGLDPSGPNLAAPDTSAPDPVGSDPSAPDPAALQRPGRASGPPKGERSRTPDEVPAAIHSPGNRSVGAHGAGSRGGGV
jgi:hypothetical protein